MDTNQPQPNLSPNTASQQDSPSSSRHSIRSFFHARSSLFTRSSGKQSQEGATWKHAFSRTINSGFGSNALRSTGYKGPREGRDDDLWLPRVLGVGRTGKAPYQPPNSMLRALGVRVPSELSQEYFSAVGDGISSGDGATTTGGSSGSGEHLAGAWVDVENEARLKLTEKRMDLSKELQELFYAIHAREREVFRIAKERPGETTTQELVTAFQGDLRTLSQTLDKKEEEAQHLKLEEVELNKSQYMGLKSAIYISRIFERYGEDLNDIWSRLVDISPLSKTMSLEEFDDLRRPALARRNWIEVLDDYAFIERSHLLVENEIDVRYVTMVLKELSGMLAHFRGVAALDFPQTRSALNEIEENAEQLRQDIFLGPRDKDRVSSIDDLMRRSSARKLYESLSSVPY